MLVARASAYLAKRKSERFATHSVIPRRADDEGPHNRGPRYTNSV